MPNETTGRGSGITGTQDFQTMIQAIDSLRSNNPDFILQPHNVEEDGRILYLHLSHQIARGCIKQVQTG